VHVDAKDLHPGAQLTADVAVVGAGPAGIVLALELAQRGRRVILIESGGVTRPGDQSLGDLSESDDYHVPMSLATRRQLGGATNLWGGRCVPFDPIDFETRPVTGGVRWPVTYDEISTYFQRACDWFQCGRAVFSAAVIPGLADRQLVPGLEDGDAKATSLERWSLPTNFGREYRDSLQKSARVTLVSNLTCTEIVCRPDATQVDHLVAKTAMGVTVTISATAYVIAAGGVETTRLLVASNAQFPRGIGNHAGHLGRWYMAHVQVRVGRVRFTTPPRETIYGHERDPDGVYVRRRFTFTRDFLASHQLPNSSMWLVNPDIADPRHGSGILSFAYLALASPLGPHFASETLRKAQIKSDVRPSVAAHAMNLMRDLPSAIAFATRFGYTRFLRPGRKVPGFYVRSPANEYPLQYYGEHLPNWDSCLEPTNDRDALGLIRIRPHVVFSDSDINGVIEAHHQLDHFLRTRKLGAVEISADDPMGAIRRQLYAGYHQAGTTRMSHRPDDGVVDADLAVHGFRDLFVASSSAFVTSGQANSTFMIVAFTLRLADHLDRLLR
jgi:hypothetical protein